MSARAPRRWRPALVLGLVLGAVTLQACERVTGFRPRDPVAPARAAPSPAIPGPAILSPEDRAAVEERDRARAAQGFIRRGATPTPALRDRTPVAAPGAEEISLNLDGADLASVVKVMMEDGLNASYVLDPRVRGTVTLQTNRPLRPDEILPTLEEILRLNNAALIERDGVYRIVPRAEAGLSAPLLSYRDAFARGLTVRVTPLRYVTVEDIAEVLDSFAPVAGTIRYDRNRNLVFSMASAPEQRTISNLIASLDVDQFAGRSFALKPLTEANANLVVEELTALFAAPGGRPSPRIRFLAIDRINGVLVITNQSRLLDQALAFMTSLDQSYGDTVRLRVYPVVNRRATDLAGILGEIFNVRVVGARRADPVAPGAAEAGGAAEAEAGADAPPETPPPAAAGALAPAGAPDGGVLRIVADESANALVALANDAGDRALQSALRRLDRQPLQVLIEATLVQVALNDTLEYGVRWFLQSGNFSFDFGDALGTGAASILPGFNAAFVTDDVTATVSALDEVTDVRILSAPSLMVLDNRKARLQVGDQVPVTIRSATSVTDPDAPLVAETEFRDTGVILEISPTVNAGGLVVLEVRQEVSDVVQATGDGNPTFSQRVIESTIAVQNGQTIALAGLIEENSNVGREGIPILSRIPVVGSAFGTTTEGGGRSELLVLIRPLVVRDQSEAQAATEELRRKLLTLQEPPPQSPLQSLSE